MKASRREGRQTNEGTGKDNANYATNAEGPRQNQEPSKTNRGRTPPPRQRRGRNRNAPAPPPDNDRRGPTDDDNDTTRRGGGRRPRPSVGPTTHPTHPATTTPHTTTTKPWGTIHRAGPYTTNPTNNHHTQTGAAARSGALLQGGSQATQGYRQRPQPRVRLARCAGDHQPIQTAETK